MERENPYLKPDRLSAIIAAIQAMSTAPWGGGTIDRWVRELEAKERSGDSRGDWIQVFEDHPEFFTVYAAAGNQVRYGLRWRYAAPITYDTQLNRDVPPEELAGIPKDDAFYERYTRRPLTADQVGVLLNTAIELHTRALAQQEARHWYLPLVSAVVAGLFAAGGALLVAWLKRGP
jgi:hypothetical protein